jgi:N-methylhydantoinase B
VATLIAANTRDPVSIIGDMQSQAEATRVAEREILRLVAKYGKETVVAGFADVQDYVERAMRQRIAALPDGEWETQDFIDRDPASGVEGMIPVKVKLTIKGDRVIYDFTGSHPCIGSLYNSAYGATFSAVAAGMKTFFPDLPLNSGFYRPIEVIAPEDTVVNARWPVAVTGFLMPFEKIMNSIYEMWSKIIPSRAIACAFNLEYLLTGGLDLRSPGKPIFMFYDWLPGGWGGRNGRDGCNVTTACFGTGLQSQPVEGQERVSPILTTEYQVLTDSPGPGRWRGGAGVRKTSILREADKTVISYNVSIGRARKDYGVILRVVDIDLAEYEVDHDATRQERAAIRRARRGWLVEDPETVAERFRAGEIDTLDAVRRYAVILDWETGKLLPNSTAQFREMFQRRAVAYWKE